MNKVNFKTIINTNNSRLHFNSVKSNFGQKQILHFCSAYYQLLQTILNKILDSKNSKLYYQSLQTVSSFGNFGVNTFGESSIAVSFNLINPNYMLSRIINPQGWHDSKYLPIICLKKISVFSSQLFFHYRQIPLFNDQKSRLFLYLPFSLNHRFNSFAPINKFSRLLCGKKDSRIRERAKYFVFEVLLPLIKKINPSEKKLKF
ncbi:MAG: hypothetical protein Q4C70_11105 [Planctomycetia bacterium]|nr:hypothetical protein [Planctomycetia bacterium]